MTDGDAVFVLTDDPAKLLDTLREQFVWSVPLGALLRSVHETVARATSPLTEELVVAGLTFTVTMVQDPEDGWWVGLVQELPGCGSQGRSLAELREMVADATREYLIARGDLSEDGRASREGCA